MRTQGRWVQRLGQVKDAFRVRRQTDQRLRNSKKTDHLRREEDPDQDSHLFHEEIARRGVLWTLLIALMRFLGA